MQDRFQPINEDLSSESDRIIRKGLAISALKDRSIGKLLVADSQDSAKSALFEINFLILASSMAIQQMMRLDAKESSIGLSQDQFSRMNLHLMQQMEGVRENGWSGMKELYGDVISEIYSSKFDLPNDLEDYQKSLGLPRDFSFEGVPLLRKSPLIWPQFQLDKFGKLIDKKLSLIPDGPDGWQYPDLPGLQRMVEEAGELDRTDDSPGNFVTP